MDSSAHDSSMEPVDSRQFRFRLGWSVDASAGSRLLSQRRSAASGPDDATAVEAHLQRPDAEGASPQDETET